MYIIPSNFGCVVKTLDICQFVGFKTVFHYSFNVHFSAFFECCMPFHKWKGIYNAYLILAYIWVYFWIFCSVPLISLFIHHYHISLIMKSFFRSFQYILSSIEAKFLPYLSIIAYIFSIFLTLLIYLLFIWSSEPVCLVPR